MNEPMDPEDVMKGTYEIMELMNKNEEFCRWIIPLVENKIEEEIKGSNCSAECIALLGRIHPNLFYKLFPGVKPK